MNKIRILSLALAVCLLLAGCQGVGPAVNAPVKLFEPAENYDVTVTPTLYWKEGKLCMELEWKNNAICSIEFGDHFGIRRLEGEDWVYAQYEPSNVATADIAYQLWPGQSMTKTYYVGSYYYWGQPGRYRLTTSFDVMDSHGNYDPKELCVEFTVDKALLSKGLRTFDVPFTAVSLSTPAIGAYVPELVSTAVYKPDQLEDYLTANAEFYDFAALESIRSNYKDKFFNHHYLIIVPVTGAQDAVDNQVVALQGDNLGRHQVTVSRQYQSIGTGSWHILLEVEKPEDIWISRGPDVETIRTSSLT